MAIYTLYFLGYYWPSYLHKCIKWILNAEKSIFFLPSIVINCLYQWFIFNRTYAAWIWINYSPYFLLFVEQNGIKIQIKEWKIIKYFITSQAVEWFSDERLYLQQIKFLFQFTIWSQNHSSTTNCEMKIENLLLLASDFI